MTVREKEIKNDSRLLAGVILSIWMTGVTQAEVMSFKRDKGKMENSDLDTETDIGDKMSPIRHPSRYAE